MVRKEKRGRTPTLIKDVFEHWPIEDAPGLPDGLKGIYVLYDPHGSPVRAGIAGRNKQDVRGRILGEYYRGKKWRHVHTFSVYTFHRQALFKQVEVLMLRAFGEALAGNIRKGKFRKATTKVHRPSRLKRPEDFVIRAVQAEGTLNRSLEKYAGRKVRIEVGPRVKP